MNWQQKVAFVEVAEVASCQFQPYFEILAENSQLEPWPERDMNSLLNQSQPSQVRPFFAGEAENNPRRSDSSPRLFSHQRRSDITVMSSTYVKQENNWNHPTTFK